MFVWFDPRMALNMTTSILGSLNVSHNLVLNFQVPNTVYSIARDQKDQSRSLLARFMHLLTFR